MGERRAAGRRARAAVPRSSLGAWTPRSSAGVVPLLLATADGLVRDVVSIRWRRMSASPFGYFRGAAAVMAKDLSGSANSHLLVQICGDAHVQNLGAYESPEGHLVFDINDFDETAEGPFEWDLLRFGTSLVLAGREAGDSDARAALSVRAFAAGYRTAMRKFANTPLFELLRLDVIHRRAAGPIDVVLRKAARATPAQLVARLARSGRSGRLRFVRTETTLPVSRDTARAVVASIKPYRETIACERRRILDRYDPVDVAYRIAGTGSVGRRNYILMLESGIPSDVVVLQVKEVRPSCWAPHPAEDEGRRVVEGQRLMQRAIDPFLGWTSVEGRPFIVRQLSDHKAGIEARDMRGKAVIEYARIAGEVFARAHARTGDAVAIASYCGRGRNLDQALVNFALAYADQTSSDYRAFRTAIPS